MITLFYKLGAFCPQKKSHFPCHTCTSPLINATICSVQDFLGTEVPRNKLDRIIDEADLLGQHRISYQEFLELWDGETDALLNASKHQVQQRRIISREPSFVSSSEQASEDGDEYEFLTEEEMILEGEQLFKDQRSLSARGGVYV